MLETFSPPHQAVFQCIKLLKQHKINQHAKANMNTAIMQSAIHVLLQSRTQNSEN